MSFASLLKNLSKLSSFPSLIDDEKGKNWRKREIVSFFFFFFCQETICSLKISTIFLFSSTVLLSMRLGIDVNRHKVSGVKVLTKFNPKLIFKTFLICAAYTFFLNLF